MLRPSVVTVGLLVGVLGIGPPAAADPLVRDVGRRLGLPRDTRSWDAAVGDLDADGVPDLVISYHSSLAFYRNTGSGLERIFARRGDDPHGCSVADVNTDGLGDVYCTRGAGHGRIEKHNTLWIQVAPGAFEDQAEDYGVDDPYGRGRRTTFAALNRDGRPDLFVGNGFPRRNERRSPNRTFSNIDGARFRQVFVGLTGEHGADCVQAADQNRDRRDDILVCGRRLFLYRNKGGGRFRDVAPALGIARRVESAVLADLNHDGRPDLTTVSVGRLEIRPGIRRARFGPPVLTTALEAGRWVTLGDIDGRRGSDVLVVQSCVADANAPDLLLLNRRGPWRFRSHRVPDARRGCGDVAAPLDLNDDGRVEFVVLNGRPRRRSGPIQVLTTRWP